MGIPQKAVARIAPHEYLALEEKATVKHEYLDGVLYAWQGHAPLSMAGGSRIHNEICQNVAFALRSQLKGRPSHVYMTDVRLHVRARDAYLYPDVAVTCSSVDQSTDPSDASVFREPSLIVEVLSDSTERFDRGEKVEVYKLLPSLGQYVLISAHGRYVEVHTKQAGDTWIKSEFRDGNVPLTSLPGILAISSIYEGIVFQRCSALASPL